MTVRSANDLDVVIFKTTMLVRNHLYVNLSLADQSVSSARYCNNVNRNESTHITYKADIQVVNNVYSQMIVVNLQTTLHHSELIRKESFLSEMLKESPLI